MDKRERVARAIARDGFGRDWDDFLSVNAHDTDQGDLLEYAQAAIAALEPMDKPRVKPLVWRVDEGRTAYAQTRYFVDRYCIEHRLHGDDEFDLWVGPDATKATRFPTLEAAKAAAQADYEARILAALEPVTVQDAREIADMPEDGTWAVLHPGHYGAFTACALNGKWSMCDDADLRFATHWLPCPFTSRALAEKGKDT